MKILLIEDDENALKILKESLELEGFTCDGYQNPVEAVGAYLKNSYDAVITDYRMPVMNGIEVLDVIRSSDPHARVVLLTAHGDLETTRKAMNRGACAFFVKPFELSRIVDALHLIERENPGSGGKAD